MDDDEYPLDECPICSMNESGFVECDACAEMVCGDCATEIPERIGANVCADCYRKYSLGDIIDIGEEVIWKGKLTGVPRPS